MPQKLKAFTLIELLVVISIIALLSSIGAASLNSTRAKARDAKRKADLKMISLALELYYDTNNQYPRIPDPSSVACGVLFGYNTSSYVSSTGTCWNAFITVLAPYLSGAPKDPLNTGSEVYNNGSFAYTYGNVIDGTSADPKWAGPPQYDLLTKLENKTDPDRCELKGYRTNAYGYNQSWCGPILPNPPYADKIYLYDVSPSL